VRTPLTHPPHPRTGDDDDDRHADEQGTGEPPHAEGRVPGGEPPLAEPPAEHGDDEGDQRHRRGLQPLPQHGPTSLSSTSLTSSRASRSVTGMTSPSTRSRASGSSRAHGASTKPRSWARGCGSSSSGSSPTTSVPATGSPYWMRSRSSV